MEYLIFMCLALVVVILTAIIIILYNKKIISNFSDQLNKEYAKCKEELKKHNSETVKQLSKQITESASMIKYVEPERDLMDIFIKLRSAIKETCVATMNQIDAARIAIYLFHNGVRSTHGINFLKMSCICEKVAIGRGIRERMLEQTNIPINLFDDIIYNLATYNRTIIMNNDEVQETNKKIFISADKINYTQIIPLYDVNNNILGLVAVEMDKSYSKDEVDANTIVLDDLAKQLIPVLSYSDYTLIKS